MFKCYKILLSLTVLVLRKVPFSIRNIFYSIVTIYSYVYDETKFHSNLKIYLLVKFCINTLEKLKIMCLF